MIRNITFAATALLAFSLPVAAGSFVETDLAPINHQQASLVVVDQDGNETAYSPAELEEMATYSLTTTTPWREAPAEFQGVMLRDVLRAHGLDTAATLLITAENDYTTTLTRELVDSVDIMVATRVDGQPHSRRVRGPIQFVIDAEVFSASNLTSESNFVWMAARIEAAD